VTGLGHRTKKFVYTNDWKQIQLHHAEAFRLSASRHSPLHLLKFSSTVVEDVFDQSESVTYGIPIVIPAIVEDKVTEELMESYGITEKPDIVVYLSKVIMEKEFNGLKIDNRDLVRWEGNDYEVFSVDSPVNMSGISLEYVVSCRSVK